MAIETLGLPARGASAGLNDGVVNEPSDDEMSEQTLSKTEAKAALRKIDRRLIPVVGILYCFSVIGRANLPSASIAGMHDDLDLSGNRYSIVLLVFFPTYILCQPIAAVLGRRLGPRIFFTGITLSTGLLIVGMGFMRTWVDLVVVRLLMGAIDSGFFASCMYLLSTWYTRVEVGKRFSFFYILVSLSYAFGGIMAFGFTYMDGLGDLSGWSWIFIMEGLLTLLTGLWGYWLLVGFPDATKPSRRFLSQRELSWVLNRVNDDRGDADLHRLDFKTALQAAKDFKIWAFGIIFFNNALVNFALANFLPIILRNNMGFNLGESQILVAPPFAVAALAMWLAGWAGDKYSHRGPILAVCMLVSIFGCALMGFHSNGSVRYVGAFLTTAGTYSAIPVSMAYQANNIRGQWKRAFSGALVVAISGLGGVVGSFVFRSKDAPRYLPGLVFCLACALFNILIVAALSCYFYIMNRRADRIHLELEASDESGDRGFRYTL